MPDILIIPQRGTTNNPSIQFSGSVASPIRLEVLQSGSVAYLGKSGSLFNITDSIVGSLMAVGDISGLPILEVFSDDKVIMGSFNKNTLYVTGSSVGVGKIPSTSHALDVSGSLNISNVANVSRPVLRLQNVHDADAILIDAYANSTPGSYASVGLGGSARFLMRPTFGGYFGIVGTDNVSPMIFVTNASPRIYLSSGGDVAIGKITANAVLDVVGNTIISGSLAVTRSLVVSDQITPSVGNNSTKGIQFPSDPGGGSGDAAWMRYYSRGGESMTLEIGISNDADDHISLMPGLGSVGIGTTTPTAKLEVAGDVVADNVLSPFLLMGA